MCCSTELKGLACVGHRPRVMEKTCSVFKSTGNLAGPTSCPLFLWVDEDLHPPIHLSVTQQESYFLFCPSFPTHLYSRLFCYLHIGTVIYPVLIYSPVVEKNLNVTTHPELAHPHNPCTPHFKKNPEAWNIKQRKCFNPYKMSSVEKKNNLLFSCLPLPRSDAVTACSRRTQLTQS